MDTNVGRPPTNPTTSISNTTKNPLINFMKQGNWQESILEAIQDFLYVLALDGRILYASASCISITGYQSTQLTGRFIGTFIHPDDADIFIKEIHDSIATGNPLRFFHRFRKADGDWIVFESNGHAYSNKEPGPSFVQGGSIYNRGFFVTSRPYPTKSAAQIDSFLEHKFENERLRNRLRELRNEEQENSGTQAGQEKTAEEEALRSDNEEARVPDNSEKPRSPVSRSIEQAQDVKTTATSRIGDVGIRFTLISKSSGSSKRTKKKKLETNCYLCSRCGTSDSPEWRRGPDGPKTLCNACGLRWAKDQKKKENEELGALPTSATKP